jgi:MoaA/NifB/PqqE/SkfB family radical SAM enzyme
MKKADIKIGFVCNNNCLFCVQGNKRNIYYNKSFVQVKEELSNALKDCKEVVFTGGEPTIHKDFMRILKIAKAMGFKSTQIQTNGRMFAYRSFCLEAIHSGADEFCIGFHGCNANMHDGLTCSQGSFKQVVKAIENIKSLGRRIATNTVITKTNFKHLPKIAKLLVDLEVDQFQFAFPHILGRAAKYRKYLIPQKRIIINYVKHGLDVGIKAGKTVMTEAIPYCFMSDYENYIAERIIPETKVFDADFVVDEYSKYRRSKGKEKNEKCKFCKHFDLCEGPWKEYPEYFGWEEFRPVKV